MNVRLGKSIGLSALAAGAAGLALFIGCRGDFAVLGGDFLSTGRTDSFFRAVQVDPRSEDSAGPQFVAPEDLNGDGLMDLVSAWNQSQPVQIHIQQRDAAGRITFVTTTIAGAIPVVSVAGLGVADFDGDGVQDIAVMLKETLTEGAACLNNEPADGDDRSGLILMYLGPADPADVAVPLAWEEVAIESARLAGRGGGTLPEIGGFTGMAVGDIDGDGDLDIVAAWNSNCGGGASEVVIFANQGGGAVRDGNWNATNVPNGAPIGSMVKDVALGDIDADGDLDIVATFPDAGSMNVRWFRNPDIDIPDDFHFTSTQWQVGTVGQIATAADVLRLADLDADSLLDVIVRSSSGRVVQWFKGPGMQATTSPLPNLPWRVYTLTEFRERTPVALAAGDINNDGETEVVVSAGGALLWLDPDAGATLYDQWGERMIIDDNPGDTPPPTTDPNVDPSALIGETLINSIRLVDLDGDGTLDIVATFDRSGLSGLTNDALVWFQNTR